jgi:hypothetical protein
MSGRGRRLPKLTKATRLRKIGPKYSDDDRIEKMFDALDRQGRDQQIIVFSCRQRAFANLGGNALRVTDWQPDY